jgi:hypothetical protein
MGHTRKIRSAWLVALVLGGVSAPAVACATDEGCVVDSIRDQFLKRSLEIASGGAEKAAEGLDEQINFEEQGCIDTYGLDASSFSLSGLADGLIDGLTDAVCSAADSYVSDQVGSIGAQIEAPMGIGGAGVGFEKGGSGVDFEHSDTELDFDFDSMVNDQMGRLPDVGTGYFEGDYSGGTQVDDIDYSDTRQRR